MSDIVVRGMPTALSPDDLVRVKDGTTEEMPEGGEALGIRRDIDYGGWIVRRGDVSKLHAILDTRNERITAVYREDNARRELVLATLGLPLRSSYRALEPRLSEYMAEINRGEKGIAGVKPYGGSGE